MVNEREQLSYRTRAAIHPIAKYYYMNITVLSSDRCATPFESFAFFLLPR
jgi:hypothetical protein